MKKIISIALFLVLGVVVLAPATPVEAQPALTRACCDAAGNVRCTLVNWTPVGNPCFCYNQGWGVACY